MFLERVLRVILFIRQLWRLVIFIFKAFTEWNTRTVNWTKFTSIILVIAVGANVKPNLTSTFLLSNDLEKTIHEDISHARLSLSCINKPFCLKPIYLPHMNPLLAWLIKKITIRLKNMSSTRWKVHFLIQLSYAKNNNSNHF